MSAPPFPMRNILHTRAKKFIYFSLVASTLAGVGWYAFYTDPRRKKYQKFFAEYDPYIRMQEICSYPTKYLHTCPSELVKRAEEKGIGISPLSSYKPPKWSKPDPSERAHALPGAPPA